VNLWGVLFVGMIVLGVLCGIAMWRADNVPIPRQSPRYIFRVVRREDRAAYRRIMRRTLAVQYRDFGRAMDRLSRDVGRSIARLVSVFSEK